METVTFKVSKSGIYYYRDFTLNEKQLIEPQTVPFFYSQKEEWPVIEKESTVEEALSIFKDFAYGGRASIYKIDGLPVLVKREMLDDVNKSIRNVEDAIKKEFDFIFEKHLKEILGDYKIEFGGVVLLKDGEYVDLSKDADKHYAVNYLCYRLLNGMGRVKGDAFDNEQGYIQDYIGYFI